MRFRGIIVAGVAAALAFGGPAHAGSFDSVDRYTGGAGPAEAWTSSAEIELDGAFSVAASVTNDPAATLTSTRPSAVGNAKARKSLGRFAAGLYDITATVTGLNADGTATGGGYAYVGLTIYNYCFGACHPVSTNAMQYAIDTSEAKTSVRGGTLTTTVRVLLAEEAELIPTAVLEAAAAGGTSVVLHPDTGQVSYPTGAASATATGVIQGITVTPVSL